MNIDKMNNIPVTIAVNPVLPPSPIPVALSTYAVTVLVPQMEPIIPEIASLKNAFSIPTALPSSSMNLHCLPNEIKVPVVSKKVTNTSENTIMIKFGILENNWLNPFANPPNSDKSKLVVITVDGSVGINMSPAPNPNAVNINPMIAVMTSPRNTAAGTFLTYKTNVSTIPINARSAGGAISDPIPTKVEGSATIIPAPLRPMNARKNPIPAPIPNFKSTGIMFRIASLTPEIVIIKKIMLETNTAASAVSQVLPIVNMIVYVNNALSPIPGANPTGYLETNPIIIHAIPDAIAVAKNTPVAGIPPSASIDGFTPKMYAIARNVVIPAMISVLKSVPFSLKLKKLSNI